MTGHCNVPVGATLTVQSGAILKFTGGYWLEVYGQLLAQGTAASNVIFTSYSDDSAGGDTAFRFIAEHGMVAFYWTDGPLSYVLTGEMPRGDLLHLAEMVYEDLEAK